MRRLAAVCTALARARSARRSPSEAWPARCAGRRADPARERLGLGVRALAPRTRPREPAWRRSASCPRPASFAVGPVPRRPDPARLQRAPPLIRRPIRGPIAGPPGSAIRSSATTGRELRAADWRASGCSGPDHPNRRIHAGKRQSRREAECIGLRRRRDHRARGARGGAQTPRHVHRRDQPARPPSPRLRGARQQRRRGARRATPTRSRSTLLPDGSISVRDNGARHPVDWKDEYDMSAVTVVLTMLHAGGKFGGGGYKVSGGLHGVGVSVVNALSRVADGRGAARRLHVDAELRARRADDRARQGRADGREHGTTVTFKPDADIFETTEVDFEVIETREREMAFLTRGPAADADRPAHRGPRGRVLRRERPGRLRAPHQQEPHADAQDADRVRARDRGRRRRGRDAVERQLPGVGALVREQHQHARGRHAPDGLPLCADAHA